MLVQLCFFEFYLINICFYLVSGNTINHTIVSPYGSIMSSILVSIHEIQNFSSLATLFLPIFLFANDSDLQSQFKNRAIILHIWENLTCSIWRLWWACWRYFCISMLINEVFQFLSQGLTPQKIISKGMLMLMHCFLNS